MKNKMPKLQSIE